MDKKLFSVIILHYNQPEYVFTALDSVLNQNYENIELIFADDASTAINLEKIQAYIEEHKNSNIKTVVYSINEENQGTVKSVKGAISQSNGEYILFFAADDALYNPSVISNFEQAFERADENTYMISSQCHMMDINMKKELHTFVKPTLAMNFNKFTPWQQYQVFCKECFLAIGSTAMRRDMFEKFGEFNEEYKLVEDWSYFLHLTRNGGRIVYEDFDGLLHRDGGVSHNTDEEDVPPHVLAYKYDIVRIFEKEILPYLKKFDAKMIEKTMLRYLYERGSYYKVGGRQSSMSYAKLVQMFPNFFIRRLLAPVSSEWKSIFKVMKLSVYFAVMYMAAFITCVTTNGLLARLAYVCHICFGLAMLAIGGFAIGIFILKSIMALIRCLKKNKERKNG